MTNEEKIVRLAKVRKGATTVRVVRCRADRPITGPEGHMLATIGGYRTVGATRKLALENLCALMVLDIRGNVVAIRHERENLENQLRTLKRAEKRMVDALCDCGVEP